MSAYMCSKAHFLQLAFALGFYTKETSGMTLVEVARELAKENQESLLYRYRGDEEYAAPPEFHESDNMTLPLELAVEPGQTHMSLRCLRYQSCEHPEWEASKSCKWLDVLEGAVPESPQDEYNWGAGGE